MVQGQTTFSETVLQPSDRSRLSTSVVIMRRQLVLWLDPSFFGAYFMEHLEMSALVRRDSRDDNELPHKTLHNANNCCNSYPLRH